MDTKVSDKVGDSLKLFTLGEELIIRGVPMVVVRVFPDRIVLRPRELQSALVKNPYGNNRHARRHWIKELTKQDAK